MTIYKKSNIFNLDIDSLQESLIEIGEPSYRAKQIWNGLYLNLFSSWDEFSSLPKPLRNKLKNLFSIYSITPKKTLLASDGNSQKILFHLHDEKPIESVLMRSGRRQTLCLSTQSGCAMDCSFCATGKMGLLRNLNSGEIIEQVLFFTRQLKNINQQLTNIVFMGMGEPFHNYKDVVNAINILNNQDGLHFGSRRITISTIGLIPQIGRIAEDLPQVNLAVSLHAPNDELRSKLVPINRRYPLVDLINACRNYIKKTNRRISFEYVLIKNTNDDPSLADELGQLVKGMLCHINLIPYNTINKSEYEPPQIQKTKSFEKILLNKGIPTTIRKSQGREIKAACGQLSGQI